MNNTHTLLTLSLFQQAVRKELWMKSAFTLINSQLDSLTLPRLKDEHWKRIVYNYIISITNHPRELSHTYAGMIETTSFKTGISIPVVASIFARTHFDNDQVPKVLPPMKVIDKDNNDTIVNIGILSQKIPTDAYLQYSTDNISFTKLMLRYSMFGTETGLFWSMPPAMIKKFDDPSRTIECFASPFNFTASNFCSAFFDDKELEYPHGYKCLGDFNAFMSGLSSGITVRFLYNPPYIRKVIDPSLKKIISHIKANPESDIIAMLPNREYESITQLIALPGTVSKVLDSNSFKIYSHSEQESFTPFNLELLLIVRMGPDANISARHMRMIEADYFRK